MGSACEWSFGTCDDRFHCIDDNTINSTVQCTEEDKLVCKVWLLKNPTIEVTTEEKIEVNENGTDLQSMQEPIRFMRKSKKVS